MDGFVRQARTPKVFRGCILGLGNPRGVCFPSSPPDAMGWHDAREIPNYWRWASEFVLQDRMFVPVANWTLPSHLYWLSGWAAFCSRKGDPWSCSTWDGRGAGTPLDEEPYAWTDITYLLHKHGVEWRYYEMPGSPADCGEDIFGCRRDPRKAKSHPILSPLPGFTTIRQNDQLRNIESVGQLFNAAASGNLPSVAWVVPNMYYSDHPPASIREGQAWVTTIVNALMRSPQWKNMAIFVAWDDWGGFYDHVVPPRVDASGYGIRAPALMISPYAKRGYIDHQTLSFDAYLKFIEDIFLGGERLDPATMGRPDPRPTVRENVPILGDLSKEFDFNQPPRPPLLLKRYPPPGKQFKLNVLIAQRKIRLKSKKAAFDIVCNEGCETRARVWLAAGQRKLRYLGSRTVKLKTRGSRGVRFSVNKRWRGHVREALRKRQRVGLFTKLSAHSRNGPHRVRYLPIKITR